MNTTVTDNTRDSYPVPQKITDFNPIEEFKSPSEISYPNLSPIYYSFSNQQTQIEESAVVALTNLLWEYDKKFDDNKRQKILVLSELLLSLLK